MEIKKEDRAFLYYRQNKNGRLNMKFGPEKYTKDSEKFSQMLFTGTLYGVSFLSSLSREHGIEFRNKQYEDIALIFNSILNDSFPDVFEKKKQELTMEEMAIEAVEKGEEVPKETLEKIEELKEKIIERTPKRKTIKEYNKETVELLEKDKVRLENEITEIEIFMTTNSPIINESVENALKNSQRELMTNLERLNKDLIELYELTDENEKQA